MAQQISRPTFPTYQSAWGRAGIANHHLDHATSDLVILKHNTAVLDDARDYRWEGLVIGGAVLGVAAALVGHSLCTDDTADKSCTRATIIPGLVGMTAGAVTGGLIGSSVHKN
jgi:hypothetical protein